MFDRLEEQHRNAMTRLRILRPNATDYVLRKFCNKHTWLLDTYLLMDSYGNTVLYAQTHNGIGIRIGAAAWSLSRDVLGFWQRAGNLDPDSLEGIRELSSVSVVLGSTNATTLGPWVTQQDLFWRLVAPLRDVHDARYKVQSVCHHMVRPTLVTNPCAGVVNAYDETARAGRDLRYARERRLQRGNSQVR
jgi:hypothetical protein